MNAPTKILPAPQKEVEQAKVGRPSATCSCPAGRAAAHLDAARFDQAQEAIAERRAQLDAWANPDAPRASMDAFFQRYGIRRGDDPLGGPVKPLYPMVLSLSDSEVRS